MSQLSVVRDLRRILREDGILAPPDGMEKYERGYRYGLGRALAVARPATTADLAAIVRYCFRNDVRVIPQGANTGLVGASTPDDSGEQLVLSLERLRGVEAMDVHNRTARVLAGTKLSDLNREAAASELFYPIDLGADPTLGGMIATNTGGARMLRYGDVQRNLLGLEVVLADADATVLSDLRGLRKDNSGVDLKQLFVGTGGSFGIVTRAQVELHRLPRQIATALLVPSSRESVPALLTQIEAEAGEFLAAFEGMSGNALAAALHHNRRLRNPFEEGALPAYAVLVELTSSAGPDRIDLAEMLTDMLGRYMETTQTLIDDAVVGRSEDLWAIRHSISDGLKAAGAVIAFDISVPRSRLPMLSADLAAMLGERFPFLRVCDFGHCGDGGDHFNLVWPRDAVPQYDPATVSAVRELVYDHVTAKYGGSFSAEHGVGPYNVTYYRRYSCSAERRLAGNLKSLCDPKGILGNVSFA
jgi:FAD/FMN-containing dehydrogenase